MKVENVLIEPVIPKTGRVPTKFVGSLTRKVELTIMKSGVEDTVEGAKKTNRVFSNRLLRSIQGRESLNSTQKVAYDKLLELYISYIPNEDFPSVVAIQEWLDLLDNEELTDWGYGLIINKFLTDILEVSINFTPQYYEVNNPYWACLVVGDWDDIIDVYTNTVGDVDDMEDFLYSIQGVSRDTALTKLAESPAEEGTEQPLGMELAEQQLTEMETLVRNRLILGECVLIDGSLI